MHYNEYIKGLVGRLIDCGHTTEEARRVSLSFAMTIGYLRSLGSKIEKTIQTSLLPQHQSKEKPPVYQIVFVLDHERYIVYLNVFEFEHNILKRVMEDGSEVNCGPLRVFIHKTYPERIIRVLWPVAKSAYTH